ncbi:uncharacterized protein LOC110053371 [Orbicella faveolata]|uniref:uncharacterized protein LOC110053371 n=1 Tax=Orbicella faveolata TaxID=48498 RepID=UPI0009E53A52|nr:uncharacterized protein LOC110053371 [Orbicella faveolata]
MRKMANKQEVLAICMLLAAVCCTSIALECVPAEGYESCACYMEGVNNTREYINLLPLKGNSSNPRFTTKPVNENFWYYLYSPCAEFNEFVGQNQTGYLPCVNASVARMTNLSTHRCESLGDKASATFKSANISEFIKSNLTLNFRSSQAQHHSAVISLICSDSMPNNESILEYVGTQNNLTDTYYLSLTSKCCCPGKCGIPPVPLRTTVPLNTTTKAPETPTAAKQSGNKGLKTWEIIAIAAGGVLLVLLIVGVYCCCRNRAGYQTI